VVFVTRPTWHETWFAVAEVMANRSLCTRRKVGAVLVKENRVISTGYNGTPPKQPECFSGGCPRGSLTGALPEDYHAFPCSGIHAEANALLRAGSVASGATLYCTHKPCPQCQNLIMGADLQFVFWPENMEGTPYEHSADMACWYPRSGRMV
jgi:dCMP deaminase